MVYARVLEACIHFTLMYMAYHIFQVLPIKDLINKADKPTTTYKLASGMKSLISNLRVSFCPSIVLISTAHVGKKFLKICHQAQKVFCGIFVGIPQHQKWYLVYVPHKQKIVCSYYVVFDDSLSSELA